MTAVICPTCCHADECEGDPLENILRCDECGTRISFGVPMPRVVVSVSGLFVTLQIADGPEYKLDRHYAAAIAKNLLSVAV